MVTASRQSSDDTEKQERNQERLVKQEKSSNENSTDTGENPTPKLQYDIRQSDDNKADTELYSTTDERSSEHFSSVSVLPSKNNEIQDKAFTTFPGYREEQGTESICSLRERGGACGGSPAIVDSKLNTSALKQETCTVPTLPNVGVDIILAPTIQKYCIESSDCNNQATNPEAGSVTTKKDGVSVNFHTLESDELYIDSLDEDDKSHLSSSLTSVTSFSSSCSACADKLLHSELKDNNDKPNLDFSLLTVQSDKASSDVHDSSNTDHSDEGEKNSFSAPEILISDHNTIIPTRVSVSTERSALPGNAMADVTDNFFTLTPTISSSSFEYVDGSETTENKKRKKQNVSAIPIHVRFLSSKVPSHIDSLPKSPWPGKRMTSIKKSDSNLPKVSPLANTETSHGPNIVVIENTTKTKEDGVINVVQRNQTPMKSTAESVSSIEVRPRRLSPDNNEESKGRNAKQDISKKVHLVLGKRPFSV